MVMRVVESMMRRLLQGGGAGWKIHHHVACLLRDGGMCPKIMHRPGRSAPRVVGERCRPAAAVGV